MSSNWQKLLKRLAILLVVNTVIKSFDKSFEHPIELSLRNLFSSSYFVGFWLGAWYLADSVLFNKRRKARPEVTRRITRDFLTLVLLSVFGMVTSYVFTFSYKSLDIYLFNLPLNWPDEAIIESALFLGNTMIFFVILGFHEFFFSSRQNRDLQLRNARLKEEQTRAKLQALLNQLDPHFLFNSLSAIEALAHKDPQKTSTYISRLSSLYRYILDVRERSLVSVAEELNFYEDYCYLMKTRHANGLEFHKNIEGLNPENSFIPPLTLQLLAENACKHNRFSPEHPLKVELKHEGDSLTVVNNLKRRKHLEPTSQSGLKNIDERYKLLTQTGIEVTETDHFFQITLPLIYEPNHWHTGG